MKPPKCKLCGTEHWARETCKALGQTLEQAARIERVLGLPSGTIAASSPAQQASPRIKQDKNTEPQSPVAAPAPTERRKRALRPGKRAQTDDAKAPLATRVSHGLETSVSHADLPSKAALRRARWRKAHPDKHAAQQRSSRRRSKTRKALATA